MELLLPIAFIGVLYLLLIRPQQKKAKEHRDLVSSLKVGDDIITIGGLHGRVADLTDATMDLEVTDDIIVRFQRSSLANVVADDGDQGEEDLSLTDEHLDDESDDNR